MSYLKPTFKDINLGFTLVELSVVFGILISLIGLITIGLANVQQRATLSSTVDSFIADFKETQIKAMVGDTEGRGALDNYGIHFDTTSYTLFHGTYDPASSSNFVVNMPTNTQITANFPNSQIIFLKGGGEVTGGCNDPTICQITVKSTVDNSEKTLTVNVYGVIYRIVSVP